MNTVVMITDQIFADLEDYGCNLSQDQKEYISDFVKLSGIKTPPEEVIANLNNPSTFYIVWENVSLVHWKGNFGLDRSISKCKNRESMKLYSEIPYCGVVVPDFYGSPSTELAKKIDVDIYSKVCDLFAPEQQDDTQLS